MTALALLLTLAAYLPGAEARYPPQGCARVTPVLALDRQQVLAGQFRDTEGNCYLWLNVGFRWWRSRVCSSTFHEIRHLHGDRHPIPRERSCRR